MGRGKKRSVGRAQTGVAALAAAVHSHAQETPDAPAKRRHRVGRLSAQHVSACGHPHLPREPITNSSLLIGAGYDPDRQVLEAEFHDGGIYRYTGVPLEVYEGIFTSASVGHYFLNDIKGAYPHECIHRSEYRETPEYLAFVKKHLRVDYIDDQDALDQAVEDMLKVESPLSIDFECAIDSYSDKTRGCLRLVQIGVDDPKTKLKKQWVIDCFHVDPTPVIDVFQSPQEKLIHYLFFEQDWASSRFGSPINNIFDSCLAWRGIQGYLANSLRAVDHLQVSQTGNVPRSIRRVLGCTITNREYQETHARGDGFGEEHGIDEDVVYAIEDTVSQLDADERELWLDQDVDARAYVTEEENLRVAQKILPNVVSMFQKAGYRVERLSPEDVIARLNESVGGADLEGGDAQDAAATLVHRSVKLRTAPLPKLNKIDEEMEPELIAELEAENRLIQEERQRIKDQIAATPYVAYLDGEEGLGFYAFPDFKPEKRASTSFHPNTLAHLAQSICGFDMPKTEQAGYWGRETLTRSQVTYAALDVAVLPTIVDHTKKVVADLGIEKDVYERRIKASEVRVAARVSEKLESGDFHDHSAKAEIALRRAASLKELEGAWNSLRTMALMAPSYKRLLALYQDKKRALRSGQRQLAPTPASPF